MVISHIQSKNHGGYHLIEMVEMEPKMNNYV